MIALEQVRWHVWEAALFGALMLTPALVAQWIADRVADRRRRANGWYRR